mmetsp:Transcript_49382/g.155328  ORF Transcript_49382/g.155328 Transcript_49382/m.155328 type:complete len:221 (-) Transcript_49382:35-697(-)
MDDDGSGSMSTEEFVNFIKVCFQGGPKAEVPSRIQGLIGGMSQITLDRIPRHRPGTEPGLPLSGVPFCLSGRDVHDRSRLAVGKKSSQPAPRHRAPPPAKLAEEAEESENDEVPQGGRRHSSTSLNPLVQTLDGALTIPSSPHGHLPPLLASTPQSSSTPVLPSIGAREKLDLSNKRTWTAPKKPLGDYKTFKGSQALNRVEHQLFEVGVDARGMYHRLR